MRKLSIACLNLLLVFNSIGFQAINATEVNPPSEETYEPSLPTEETNSDDSIKENTDTSVSTEETTVDNTENDNLSNNLDEEYNTDADLSTEEDIITVDDSINEENTLEINDSFEDEQISTVATRAIAFLDKEKFLNTLPENATNLYFGTKNNYDLSKCTKPIDLGNNYSLYSYKYKDVDKKTELIDIYVICENGSQIFFPEDSSYLFAFHPLKQITFKNVNTSYVTNMSFMFWNCKNLTSLDLSNFNTSKVTSMYYMFAGCENLTSLDVTNFNTENVKIMNDMFFGCNNLTSLDLSNFNTSKVASTSMEFMFAGCNNLTSLNLSNFNTENVTYMSRMFYNCESITSMDLSNFNTSKVISMTDMFSGCKNLTSLNLSNFNTSKVTSMYYMFAGCNKLKTIYASNLFTAKENNSKDMFGECTSLIGSLGTKYDSSKIDYEYAHIDGGTSNPGYFSCKHIWDEGKVTTEPTCVNKGTKTFKCTKCDATKTEDIVALGHEYSTEWTIDTPASCTQEGSESHHCTRCDAKTGDRPIAKTDHTWDSGVVTTEPTCETKGTKTFKCTKCDATKTEDIVALGHELTHVTKKDATTEEFGNIEYWNCSKCKKNFSDSEGTNEITGSTVILKLAPSIIKGDNQTVTEKEEKALSVTSNASYDDFIEVKVDGTTLDISKYAKAKGSTIITLNADYVSSLSVGTHTLDVVSKFGTATAHFKVEKKVEITPTPETNKSSTTDKTSTGWDDGGPFTTDKCGNVFDRWNNKIYEANGCNVGGYNLVRTSVVD